MSDTNLLGYDFYVVIEKHFNNRAVWTEVSYHETYDMLMDRLNFIESAGKRIQVMDILKAVRVLILD
jgi:hypothetical protein